MLTPRQIAALAAEYEAIMALSPRGSDAEFVAAAENLRRAAAASGAAMTAQRVPDERD